MYIYVFACVCVFVVSTSDLTCNPQVDPRILRIYHNSIFDLHIYKPHLIAKVLPISIITSNICIQERHGDKMCIVEI